MTRFSTTATLLLVALLVGCTDSFVGEYSGRSAEQSGAVQLSSADVETVAAKKSAPILEGSIAYVFAGHLQIFDDAGRLLAWDATIEGDINGAMKWWFVLGAGPPNLPEQAHIGFYEARWEIWDGDTLLLAGNSSGTTAQPKDKDGIWRGNGVVTETGSGYEDWMGRRIFEGGNVDWNFPYSGQGIFRVN